MVPVGIGLATHTSLQNKKQQQEKPLFQGNVANIMDLIWHHIFLLLTSIFVELNTTGEKGNIYFHWILNSTYCI